MKKIALYAGLAILSGIVIYVAWPKKKPCPCSGAAQQASESPDAAIDKMTEPELIQQIGQLSKMNLAGKTIDELKAILKSLIVNK